MCFMKKNQIIIIAAYYRTQTPKNKQQTRTFMESIHLPNIITTIALVLTTKVILQTLRIMKWSNLFRPYKIELASC